MDTTTETTTATTKKPRKRMTTIATVKSFSHGHEVYQVILHNRHWQCSCLDWFFRRQPCKHIRAVRTLHHVAEGAAVQKKVDLKAKGEPILRRWRERHGLPMERPEGYKPPPKDDEVWNQG